MSPLILTYTFLLLTKPILIKKYRVLNKSYLTFLISILLLGIYFINHCISLIFLVFIPLLLELLEIENSFEKIDLLQNMAKIPIELIFYQHSIYLMIYLRFSFFL